MEGNIVFSSPQVSRQSHYHHRNLILGIFFPTGFESLFTRTEQIMVGIGGKVMQKQMRREQQINREVMAEIALRRNQRGEDMGIPNPNDPYQGFNPINVEPDNDGFGGNAGSSSGYYGGQGPDDYRRQG